MLSIVLEINDEEDDEMDNYSIHKCFKYINDTVGVIKNAYDEGNVGVLEILTSTHVAPCTVTRPLQGQRGWVG